MDGYRVPKGMFLLTRINPELKWNMNTWKKLYWNLKPPTSMENSDRTIHLLTNLCEYFQQFIGVNSQVRLIGLMVPRFFCSTLQFVILLSRKIWARLVDIGFSTRSGIWFCQYHRWWHHMSSPGIEICNTRATRCWAKYKVLKVSDVIGVLSVSVWYCKYTVPTSCQLWNESVSNKNYTTLPPLLLHPMPSLSHLPVVIDIFISLSFFLLPIWLLRNPFFFAVIMSTLSLFPSSRLQSIRVLGNRNMLYTGSMWVQNYQELLELV